MDTLSVLVIDDDETIYEIIETALNAVGVTTVFATNADKGMQFAHEYQPQLILMDLVLPDIKGWEAIEILKSEPSTQHIPVIALTAGSNQYIKQALQAGANDFISKPFNLKTLQRIVSQYMGATQR